MLSLCRRFTVRASIGVFVAKCTLAVRERQSKLPEEWSIGHDQAKMPFLPGKARTVMSVTTFEGVVENGQIRLPADICLPEKAKVYVIIPNGVVPPPAFL